MTSNTILLAVCGLVIALVMRRKGRFSDMPLPPSPPADPLIGHSRIVPRNDQDMFYYKLGRTYGPVTLLNVFGKHTIVLNSLRAAEDLLGKRAANYSGRPRFPIAEVAGIGRTAPLLDYGPEWRRQQRTIQRYFSKDKIQTRTNRAQWVQEARTLIPGLVSRPADFNKLFLDFATSVITHTGYGHKVDRADDPHVGLVEDVLEHALPLSQPSTSPVVDLFPFLKYCFWLPTNYNVRLARKARKHVREFGEHMIQETREKLEEALAIPSFLVDHLGAVEEDAEEIETIELRRMTISLYLTGIETTAAILSNFVAAMILHPGYQKKAQDEIDSVLQGQRLPTFSDRDSFPFLECVIQETIRWRPPLPTGIPHKSREDDIYDGMFIPKHTVVIPNIRGMTLDDTVYQLPHEFNPTRYLPTPRGRGEPFFPGAFGFGRRACPGRYLAEDITWIAIATILSTVTIEKVTDSNGLEIEPKAEFETKSTCHAKSLPCKVRPRNIIAHHLVSQTQG